MSAFAGIFRRDGGPVAASGLSSAEVGLAARGSLHWHRRFDWAMGASLPIAGRDDASPVTVAADARLDNRIDLIAELDVSGSSTDAAIIAAAYQRWEDNCPERLEGDFAFTVYDRRQDRLFCARDHFGVRPFYYHLDDRLFAAATVASFLIAIPAIGDVPNDAGIADLIAGGYADHSVTVHQGVMRLPPGHALSVTRSSSRITRFWTPADVPIADHRDAPAKFAALFHDAIRRRIDDCSTGVMLSGGLDSSAVALEAAGIRPMRSLSMTLDRTPGWNERPYIEAVLRAGRFHPEFIAGDDHDPLADLPRMLDEQEGPFVACNSSLSRRIYARAADSGLAVLLDGHGGDEIVSHGLGRLNELAAGRQWRELWRESAGIAGIYGVSPWKIMSPYLSHNPGIRHTRQRWNHMRTRLGWPPEIPFRSLSLVEKKLATRTGLLERHQEASSRRSARHSERDLHIEALSAPQQAYGFEILDRMSAAAGVTSRYPFYDLKLAQFCLSLPSREKLADGLPRRVLREAMKGVMPEKVRLRLDKYDFAPSLADALLRRQRQVCNLVRSDRTGIGAYIDMDVARAALERLLDRGRRVDGGSLFAVWRTVMLALWLDRSGEARAAFTQPQDIAA
ncbi:MAG: asparagine synthase-related protein [Rhizorhabdus sp.]